MTTSALGGNIWVAHQPEISPTRSNMARTRPTGTILLWYTLILAYKRSKVTLCHEK